MPLDGQFGHDVPRCLNDRMAAKIFRSCICLAYNIHLQALFWSGCGLGRRTIHSSQRCSGAAQLDQNALESFAVQHKASNSLTPRVCNLDDYLQCAETGLGSERQGRWNLSFASLGKPFSSSCGCFHSLLGVSTHVVTLSTQVVNFDKDLAVSRVEVSKAPKKPDIATLAEHVDIKELLIWEFLVTLTLVCVAVT